MRGSRNFVQGGGGSRSIWQKSSDNLFLVFSLFYSRKWLISKKTIIFQGSRGVQHFPGGGVQLFPRWGVPIAYSYRKYITCDFPGEVRTPCPPPLDPHLGLSMVLSIHAENAPNLTNRYLGMFLEGQVHGQTDRQTDGCIDGRRQNNIPPTSSGGNQYWAQDI